MRSKKAKVEDGEEGGEDEAEGEQFMAVDHEDDAGQVFIRVFVPNSCPRGNNFGV